MKIKRIELIHIAIPLKKSFETSFGVIAERPALIVKMIADDGTSGCGESSPLYVPLSEPETLAQGMEVLKKILPDFIGLAVDEGFDISARYQFKENPVSLIGIEAAYLDLLARAKKIPLQRVFGGTQRTIRAGESVGLKDSIGEVIQEVADYINAGYLRIKIKIAPGKDEEIVREVRKAFPGLRLGADANAAYHEADFALLEKLKKYNLAFIEQPFQADDYELHARLHKSGIRVCLDETVRDLTTCMRAVESGGCDMVNVKPGRIGSFAESKKIHDFCVPRGVALFGGGRLETGLGKTINAAFYSLPGFTEASDITPPAEYFEEDIITPQFSITKGIYEIPQGGGAGISLNEEAISRHQKEKIEIG